MTKLTRGQPATVKALRFVTESFPIEQVGPVNSTLSFFATDRSRVETLSPAATAYQIERRDLARNIRVYTAQRRYQEIPILPLLSPQENARFLRSGRHWRKRHRPQPPAQTRDILIHFTYEKTTEEARMFGLTAHKWITTRTEIHEGGPGESLSESTTEAWYLDSDEVRLRYPGFSETLIHRGISFMTLGDQRVRFEHTGERPRGLCAQATTTSRNYAKVRDGHSTDRTTVHGSRIVSMTEELLPFSMFEAPEGYRKMPVYPGRITMAREDLVRQFRRLTAPLLQRA